MTSLDNAEKHIIPVTNLTTMGGDAPQLKEDAANATSDAKPDASENNDGDSQPAGGNALHRDFKPRQVFMFSIACAIGTGLVIGSGTALSQGGPGSLLIAYLAVGAAVFFVMTALGEMAAFLPMDRGFGGYATRMVDPAFGFATGWNYYFKYIVAAPTNLTATGIIIQYWRPDLSIAIWITVFGVVIILINFLPVNNLGETEFWLGLAKVLIMSTLILATLTVALGGGPNRTLTGFRYWKSPGAFARHVLVDGDESAAAGRFLGFWACVCQACFAFCGTEVVGITFGETPNPRRNIPRAINQTFWRIGVFYILAVFVLGMAVPYDIDKLIGATKQATSGAASPFVVAVSLAGVGVFPDIINASLLVFTLSAACTDIYCSSRTLYGLARDSQAPSIFTRTRPNGVPLPAVMGGAVFTVLAYLNVAKSSAVVFGYLVSLVTVFAVLNWVSLLVSHIFFRRAIKAQGISLEELPYVSRLQPWGSYYALVVSVLIVLFYGYDAFYPRFKPEQFVLKYIGTFLYVGNVVFWKWWQKTTRVTSESADLVSGRREFEEESVVESHWKGNA